MSRNAIEIRDLTKRFGPVVAVDGLSFRIGVGETVGLLGGNGAGKTTTIAMLLGLLLPSSGTITVLGEDLAKHRYRVLPRMNFSSPYVDLPKRLTPRENLDVFARLYEVADRKARIAELAEALHIEEFLNRPMQTLSAGQKTRVSLAKALINSPELLLLDEPTASLDPDTADWIRVYLESYKRKTGATLVLASHNMHEVERLATRVMMMRAGRIVDDGAPATLLAKYGRRNLEEVFLDIARNRAPDETQRNLAPDETQRDPASGETPREAAQ
jgi:ABC-2 type transport system ATP-binding protein